MENEEQIKINTEIKFFMNQVRDDITYIKEKLDNLENVFVTRKEFTPIRAVVYGLVGMILTAVVGALLVLVMK